MFNRVCFGALLLAGLAVSLTGCATQGLDSISISPNSNLQLVVGNPATIQLTATGTYGNGSHPTTQNITSQVTWTSALPAVATVSSTGLVSAGVTAGYTTITATMQGFNGVISASVEVTVNACTSGCTTAEPYVSLAITPAADSVALPGQTGQFIALGTTNTGLLVNLTSQVTWSATNVSVATICTLGSIAPCTSATNGLATGVGQGTTPITAIWTNPDKTVLTANASFTVTGVASEPLQSLAITPNSATVALPGQTSQLIAIGTFSPTSSTPGTRDLTTTVVWASSNVSVATITKTGAGGGLVTAVGQGTTVITAEATNPDGSVVTATATFTVTGTTAEPLVSLAIVPNAQTLTAVGQSVGLIVIGTTSTGTTVNLTNQSATINGKTIPAATWNSSVASVASIIPATGVATAVANGTTAITAMALNPDGTVVTGTATLTVNISATQEPLVSLAIVPNAQTLTVSGQQAGLVAIGTTSTGATVNLMGTVVWKSSVNSVAGINSATGVVTAAANGTTAITAVATNPDGTVVTGTATITVNIPATPEPYVSLAIVPAAQTVTVANQFVDFIAIGTTGTGTTVNLTNTAIWKSSVPTVASITPAGGVATALTNGVTAITAVVSNVDGTVVTGTAILTVNISATQEPLVSLAIVPASQTVAGAGQNAQFLAIGTFSSTSPTPGTQNMANISTYTMAWYSSNSSVATINNSGLAMTVGQGTTAITAIATNKTDGSSSFATATLTVTGPSTQEITALSIIPGSQTITMPLTVPTTPTTSFVAIGTLGSTGLQLNETNAVNWSSSNTAVATINSSGGVIPLSQGTTTITAQFPNPAIGSTPANVVTATATLTVNGEASEPLLSMTVLPAAQTVTFPGQTSQLIAIGTYSSAPVSQNLTASVSWSSSNTAVATVCTVGSPPPCTAATNGLVTAVGQGTVAITAIAKNADNSVVTGVAAITVTNGVAEQVTALSIVPGSLAISATGQPGQFIALGTSGSTGLIEDVTVSPQLTWSSSIPAYATIATYPTPNEGQAVGVSPGTTNITAEWSNVDKSVVTATASVSVTTTAAAEPLLSIAVLPASATINDLLGNQQYLAYGTFSTAPTVMDITNGFYHAGFPSAACTAVLAAAKAAPCAQVAVAWVSSAQDVFPINSSGVSGATGGLVTADGSGTDDIYAVAQNPDGTLVYSPVVTFSCPLVLPTYDNTTTPPTLTNIGSCNELTIASGLLVTLTVFNAGTNTANWLVEADSATGTPNVIHCGPGWAADGNTGGSVCMATYPLNSTITLRAPAQTGVNFGGWSWNCTPVLPINSTGPNSCQVTLGTAGSSNISVGAIFN